MTDSILTVIVREKTKPYLTAVQKVLLPPMKKEDLIFYRCIRIFVSIVHEVLELIKPDNSIHKIPIQRGILRIKENNVEVYIGL